MKRAIVIGGTGMVGRELVSQLIANDEYTEILSLVRRASGFSHPKLNEVIVDFDHIREWESLISGDVLFSSLGTTIKQAKTKEEQFKVDFKYQYSVAEAAARKGVPIYVLVSSAGASTRSRAFYMNMKGQLEEAVDLLPFKVFSIIRPGQLDGHRTEKRPAERLALFAMHGINKIGLLKRFMPIRAELVAKAMICAAAKEKSASYTLSEVFELAKQTADLSV